MKLWFDGGCRPNPGTIETAVFARGQTWIRSDYGPGDNNDAEWLALIDALRVAGELGVSDVVLIGDSQLVADQALGRVRRIGDRFAGYLAQFRALEAGFARVRVRQVKRSQNLAGIALDRMSGKI